jgi:hypothetical protein
MNEQAKSLANQVSEITKLVNDAQDTLDQVLRALSTLQARVAADALVGPEPMSGLRPAE